MICSGRSSASRSPTASTSRWAAATRSPSLTSATTSGLIP